MPDVVFAPCLADEVFPNDPPHWENVCTASLDAGTWLLMAQYQLGGTFPFGPATTLLAFYDDNASQFHSMSLHQVDPNNVKYVNGCKLAVVTLSSPGDVHLQIFTTHPGIGVRVMAVLGRTGVATADLNDLSTNAITSCTHMTAIKIDPAVEYVYSVPASDVAMALPDTNYDSMSVDLTAGTWLILGCVSFPPTNVDAANLDHVFCMLGTAAGINRYVDDGFGAGSQLDPNLLLHTVVKLTAPATWKTMIGAVLGGMTVPKEFTDGTNSANSGAMFAVKVANDAARSLLLPADVQMSGTGFDNLMDMLLPEGKWMMLGNTHIFHAHPDSTFNLAIFPEFWTPDTVEYSLVGKNTNGDPVGTAATVYNDWIFDVDPGDTLDVWLRAYSQDGGGADDGPGSYSGAGGSPACSFYKVICPSPHWIAGPPPEDALIDPHPLDPPPLCPDSSPIDGHPTPPPGEDPTSGPAAATCMTAFKIPFEAPVPILAQLSSTGTTLWEDSTAKP